MVLRDRLLLAILRRQRLPPRSLAGVHLLRRLPVDRQLLHCLGAWLLGSRAAREATAGRSLTLRARRACSEGAAWHRCPHGLATAAADTVSPAGATAVRLPEILPFRRDSALTMTARCLMRYQAMY